VRRIIRRHKIHALVILDPARATLLCGVHGARLAGRTVGRVLWLHACPGHGAADARRLVIAGGFWEQGYARHCVRMAPENVNFLGFLGPEFAQELAELYSNAALVVLPSALEGASLVLLEAAAYGKCILGADMPANRELMDDGMVYVVKDNVTELIAQISRCLTVEELRVSVSGKAKRRVETCYSVPSMAAQMESVYTGIVG